MGSKRDERIQGRTGKRHVTGSREARVLRGETHLVTSIGDVYGFLEVVSEEEKKVSGPNTGHYCVQVRCLIEGCSVEKWVPSSRLRRGIIATCGKHRELPHLPVGFKSGFLEVIGKKFLSEQSGVQTPFYPVRCTAPGCGKELATLATLLRRSKVKSCGCQHRATKIENLVGRTFGKLFVESPGKRKYAWWCVCSCPARNKRHVVTAKLLNGIVTMCANCANKKTYDLHGVSLTVDELSKLTKVPYRMLQLRLNAGWSVEKAMLPQLRRVLTAEERKNIVASSGTHREVAIRFGVSRSCVEQLRAKERRKKE